MGKVAEKEKKRFYCVRCQKKHLVSSGKGKSHWMYDISKITETDGCRADLFLAVNGIKVRRSSECKNVDVALTIMRDKIEYPVCNSCWVNRVSPSEKW